MTSFEGVMCLFLGTIICEIFTLCIYILQIRDFLYAREKSENQKIGGTSTEFWSEEDMK